MDVDEDEDDQEALQCLLVFMKKLHAEASKDDDETIALGVNHHGGPEISF